MGDREAGAQPVHVTNTSQLPGGSSNDAEVDVKKLGGNTINTNGGAKDTGTQTVTLATDDPAVSALGATSDAKVDSDAVGSVSAKLRGLVSLIASVLATIGSAVLTKALQIAGSDGTNARLLRTTTDGRLETRPAPVYTDTQMLTDASADNSAPTGTDGTALQSDTKHAYISVVANADVTNADINLWAREKGTDVWFLIPGGSMDDLQSETDDRWGMRLPNVGEYATRLYVEIDNYTDGGSGTINAYLRESTV